jgi:hypothetical protein
MKTRKSTVLAHLMRYYVQILFALIFTICTTTAIAQTNKTTQSTTIYYVSVSGSDTNDGLSWENAFATIQKGIDEANTIGSDCEVWVSEGTYYPTDYLSDSDGQESTDVYKSILMYNGVHVYGGFEGTETTKEIGVAGGRQLSDIEPWSFEHTTTIDGSPTESYHTVWFGTNGFDALSYMGVDDVMIPSALPDETIMDGFTITGGFSNLDIRIENTTESKSQFVHLAGGGVALVGSGILQNCIVENNMAKYGGAGVAMFDGATLENCLIQNNEAVGANFYSAGFLGFGAFDYWRCDGAGIVALGFDNQAMINNCKIHDNLGQANDNYPDAATSSSNKVNNGGGLYLSNSIVSNSIISSNNIAKNPPPYEENSSASCGGGIYVFSKGIVDNCEITDNGFVSESQNGAGIFMADYTEEATSYDDIILRNSYIHSNRAGGGVAVDAQYSTLENNIVANNIGVGIYGYGNCRRMRAVNCLSYNNSSIGYGHSTNTNNQENTLINSTIVRNGSGVSIGNANSHEIHNSIVWGNNSNSSNISNATVSYSAFSFTPPVGTGNVELSTDNTDIKFNNPTSSHGVGVSDWQSADFNLGLGSNCIDVANQAELPVVYTNDVVGNDRVLGCELDMGAYESSMGGPVVSLAANTNEFGQSADLPICLNSDVEISAVEAITGTFPFTVSWTVNGSSTHELAGNDVEITSDGQVLLDFVATEDNYNIEFTAIADDTGCDGIPDIYNISIETYQTEPVFMLNDENISETSEIQMCENESANLMLSELNAGQFPLIASWTVNGSDTHLLAGNDVLITGNDFELFNETLSSGLYEIQFTTIQDNVGCNVANVAEHMISLIVNPQPSLVFEANEIALSSAYSEEFCQNTGIELSVQSLTSGMYPILASWEVNGDPAHDYSMENVEITDDGEIFFSEMPDAGTYEFEFTSIIDANGCEITDLSELYAEITLIELPAVTCGSDITHSDVSTITLDGATPTGGIYSGTGVSGDLFDPTGLTNGDYPITYTYTDGTTGCSNYCEFIISLEIPTELSEIDINEDVQDTSICYGTSEVDAISSLAQQITISDVAGGTYLVDVNWTIDTYDANTPNTYQATGSFDLPTPVLQTTPPTDLTLNADVTVEEEPQINVTVKAEPLASDLSTSYCDDEPVEMLFVNATNGNYPFTVSWTVNEADDHTQAGNNVIINDENQVLISEIMPLGIYDIQFTSIVDGNGCAITDLSEYFANIEVTSCIGINMQESETIAVYPNPATNTLHVTINSANFENTAQIINVLGETVLRINDLQTETDINIAELTKGYYILLIETDNKTEQIKFVKQ